MFRLTNKLRAISKEGGGFYQAVVPKIRELILEAQAEDE